MKKIVSESTLQLSWPGHYPMELQAEQNSHDLLDSKQYQFIRKVTQLLSSLFTMQYIVLKIMSHLEYSYLGSKNY